MGWTLGLFYASVLLYLETQSWRGVDADHFEYLYLQITEAFSPPCATQLKLNIGSGSTVALPPVPTDTSDP